MSDLRWYDKLGLSTGQRYDFKADLLRYDFKADVLLKYGTDLTQLAMMGKLDPVIGRDEEIGRLVQILTKRRKNNACLIGDPGVGKTAIVEGLALKIIGSSLSSRIWEKRIFSIDLARLSAGATLYGQLEERVVSLLEQVRDSKGAVILFIDELHCLFKGGGGGGGGNGSRRPDPGAILKPALARDDLKVIGATTPEEYTKYMQSDAALQRRFLTIEVQEPSREVSIRILKGIIHKYNSHHEVVYDEAALVSAVDLSTHYMRDLLLPDKAIDLIDEAGGRVWSHGRQRVKVADIEHAVSTCTGIPLNEITAVESQRLVQLEQALNRSLIGQDEAVAAVSRSILRARAGIRDETKPIGCFLFTGPTGVGKTEMAKILAKEYFGSEEAMVRLDMSEYMDPIHVTRLIGSPPGYGGHDEGGQLTELIRRRPHSLVLLDEIEKADGKVLNLLLQVFDDGRLTDGKGKTVDFRHTIIILTSNVSSEVTFKVELLNRFDQVVVFKPLEKEHIEQILEIFLRDFGARVARKKKIEVVVSKQLKKRLVLEGSSQTYGARMLKRTITRVLEDDLAEKILIGSVREGDTILMDCTPQGKGLTWIQRPDYKFGDSPRWIKAGSIRRS